MSVPFHPHRSRSRSSGLNRTRENRPTQRTRLWLLRLEERNAPATFTVLNTDDAGAGSLRQAILDSNALAGADSITFDTAAFGTPQTITLTTGELSIAEAVTITGPGADLVTVSGNNATRVFNIDAPGSASSIKIEAISIAFGKSTAGKGGGILNVDEALTLSDCNVVSNAAVAGGGIFIQMAAGSLSLANCIVSGNVTSTTGDGYGGGIAVDYASVVAIDRCTVSNNSANNGGGIGFHRGGSLSLTNSSVNGNSASGGGGLFFFGSDGIGMLIRNSTISGNFSSGTGGGIYGRACALLLQNSTVTRNENRLSSSGIRILAENKALNLAIESSIVSGNLSAMGLPPVDVGLDTPASTTILLNNSAIGTSAATFSGSNNLPFGISLKLGPLDYNGGSTVTHLPALESPLVNKGANAAGLTTDQRGNPFDRRRGPGIDIGATEAPTEITVYNANDSGTGSLRQGILAANATPGPESITFDPAVFNSPQTITLTTGELAISDALSITGPGAALATVNGNNASRVFNMNAPSSGNAVAISGLTIAGGKTTGSGGGIFNQDEALSLTNCVITGNSAGVSGGGIFVQSGNGTLALQGCTVSNNQVPTGSGLEHGDGGGINLNGPSALTIDRSTISGNTANDQGGGIYFYQNGSLNVTNSTISGNTAKSGRGGGVYFFGTVTNGAFRLRNSTLSGNAAGTEGGGIALCFVNGRFTVQNCTITENSSGKGAGGIARTGTTPTGRVYVESSIISGNTGLDSDVTAFSFLYLDFCAIGGPAGQISYSGSNNLPFGTNLKLAPLADNGGPTKTHALDSASPAVNAGSNPLGLTTDQRGLGYVRVFGSGPDIGAFELQPLPPTVQSVVINKGAAQRSRVTSVAVTFDTLVTLPATPVDAFELKRQSDDEVVELTAAVANGATTTVTLTFNGILSELGSLQDGRFTLRILASKVSNAGGPLDGDGNNIGGDDYQLVSAGTSGMFRLFGDNDGDGDNDSVDFLAFRATSGLMTGDPGFNPAFDFSADGDVDALDFLQFRSRFGTAV